MSCFFKLARCRKAHHGSTTYALMPTPHSGSTTKSLELVVVNMHLSNWRNPQVEPNPARTPNYEETEIADDRYCQPGVNGGIDKEG